MDSGCFAELRNRLIRAMFLRHAALQAPSGSKEWKDHYEFADKLNRELLEYRFCLFYSEELKRYMVMPIIFLED